MNARCSRYFEYAYDPVGNRTSLQTRRRMTLYSYDAADELLSTSKHRRRDVITYTYDLNGNETRAGEKRYSYNLGNELIEPGLVQVATGPGGRLLAERAYAARGNTLRAGISDLRRRSKLRGFDARAVIGETGFGAPTGCRSCRPGSATEPDHKPRTYCLLRRDRSERADDSLSCPGAPTGTG